MATEEPLITVAIHTYDRATKLKALLEHEGIHVVLHNVNLTHPVVSSGIRVRIKESDLPQALRVIENSEIFTAPVPAQQNSGKIILVPVDFSDCSYNAALYAFHLASEFNAEILLLHSFVNPALSQTVQLTDVLSFDLAESKEIGRKLTAEADEAMNKFTSRIRNAIKSGDVPPVVFKTSISEGVPEDVILETAKNSSPTLIVMGTRGVDRKELEMMGSVTAEVLDSCRNPVFTVPENVSYSSLIENENILFFGNLDQEEMIAMDTLHKFFPDEKLAVSIAKVPGKKDSDKDISKITDNLLEYFSSLYTNYSFSIERIDLSNSSEDVKNILHKQNIGLIVLPNKRRNVFVRFFNPSLAHKLLLHTDTPMLVIPV